MGVDQFLGIAGPPNEAMLEFLVESGVIVAK